MNAQVEHDDDLAWRNRPMSPIAGFMLGLGTALAYEAVGAVPPKGSPAAIADCQRRREEAIQIAQAATEQAGEYDPTDDEGGD